MAQEWNIQPRDSRCHQCQNPFADGQRCYSSLFFDAGEYVRADLCERCDPDFATQPQALSTWQGVYHEPPPPREEVLKKETAESLLRRMMEESDEHKAPLIYILALMLERKRILIEKSTRLDASGALLRLYEHRHTGEAFVVPDPQLQLAELEQVQKQVALLSGAR